MPVDFVHEGGGICSTLVEEDLRECGECSKGPLQTRLVYTPHTHTHTYTHIRTAVINTHTFTDKHKICVCVYVQTHVHLYK